MKKTEFIVFRVAKDDKELILGRVEAMPGNLGLADIIRHILLYPESKQLLDWYWENES